MFRVTVLTLALLSAGCVIRSHVSAPGRPVPTTLPGAHGEANTVVSQWQQVMNDARLKSVVTMALNSNRDVQKRLRISTPPVPSMAKRARPCSRRWTRN